MNSIVNQNIVSDYLDQHFPQFDPQLKQVLSENCTIREFESDSLLMTPGQYFRSTMLIVEGRVKIYREGEGGKEFFIYYLEPGEACALSMICATRQQKSEIIARSVEKSTALLVPTELMDELMQKHRSWYYFVLETYRSNFEELLEVVDSVAFKAMDERLEFYLKNQQKQLGTDELSMTHQQIADDLNSSREVISRLLKKMEQKGEIVLGRNSIQIIR